MIPAKNVRRRTPGERMRRAGILERAEVSLRLGDDRKAETLSRRVLAVDANHLGALELLAKVLWRKNRHGELVLVMRRLIQINAYEPGYHALLAAAYECLGCYTEAMEAHRRCGSAESQEAIADLRVWQGGLVAELVKSDPVFAAHYAQNACEACASRGFGVTSRCAVSDTWMQASIDSAYYGRPS